MSTMMFTEGKMFCKQLDQIKEKVAKLTDCKVTFEEYVIVPCFGFIILRFNISDNIVTLDELDKYETLLYEIVGNDYLIDFMGSVYRSVGVNFEALPNKLKQLSNEYLNENIDFNPPYKQNIQNDAKSLLAKAGLSLTHKVWEMQIEEDEINLLIFGKDNRLIKIIQGKTIINVLETKEEECVGLVKAIFYARRNEISLARLLCD